MPSNILVIVVDGLRASALGAYGNTSFATPALDRLAADGLLLDSCFAPSPDLEDIYHALWNSVHPARADSKPSILLPGALSDRGYSTKLVTDEPLLQSPAATAGFDEIVQLASERELSKHIVRTDDPSKTELACVFAAATESMQNAPRDKPQFIWLHARGMYGAWDAPIEFQESLLDEGDPPPLESAEPPDVFIEADSDPDAAFRYASAYAAQVIVLDECVESLLESMPGGESWLVTLIGARSFPLGEHGRIGGIDSRLYAETLHVPWLVRLPGNKGNLTRSGLLTSHLDILPTLLDGTNAEVTFDSSNCDGASVIPLATATPTVWRDAVISSSESAAGIRTSAWSLRRDRNKSSDVHKSSRVASPEPELYVRPDDRWEANNIAKLCPDVVDELAARLASLEDAAGRC